MTIHGYHNGCLAVTISRLRCCYCREKVRQGEEGLVKLTLGHGSGYRGRFTEWLTWRYKLKGAGAANCAPLAAPTA